MVRQLGAKDWDRGNGAGQGDGQRTVQAARVKSDVLDTWGQPREKEHDSKST